MKAWQIGGTVLGVAAVSILFVPSANDAVGEKWRRLTGDPGQACFDYQRTSIKDPYSARFDGYSISPSSDSHVTVKYHAKNSYGAYTGGEALCVISSGQVNEYATGLARENALGSIEIEKMKAENKCLDKKISLMWSGNLNP